MTLPLIQYSKVINKYCIRYSGRNANYVRQLKYVRPLIEKEFKDLEIHLIIDNELFSEIKEETNAGCISEFSKVKYGYIRDLLFDGKNNPVIKLLEESNIVLSDAQKLEFFQL